MDLEALLAAMGRGRRDPRQGPQPMDGRDLETTVRISLEEAHRRRAVHLSLDDGGHERTLVPTEAGLRLFSVGCVTRMRAASKLRLDFGLALFAVALLLDHIQRIETLEQQVRSLQAQLPRRHWVRESQSVKSYSIVIGAWSLNFSPL